MSHRVNWVCVEITGHILKIVENYQEDDKAICQYSWGTTGDIFIQRQLKVTYLPDKKVCTSHLYIQDVYIGKAFDKVSTNIA